MPWVCLGGRAASNHRPRPLLHLRDLFLMPAGRGSWNFGLRSSFTLMQLFVGFQFFSVSYEIILFEFFVLLCLVVAPKCFAGSDDKQTRPRFLLCSFFCNRAPSSPPHLLLSSSPRLLLPFGSFTPQAPLPAREGCSAPLQLG